MSSISNANFPVIQSQVSLKAYNSFNLDVQTQSYVAITDKEQLKPLAQYLGSQEQSLPFLVLGGGSNVLFTEDFQGLLIHNQLLGKELVKTIVKGEEVYLLNVAAGENWHDLVQWTLEQGLGGLENLALIPGSVGAAPVQNIGAYGCDFSQFCHSVECFDLATGKFSTLNAEQCLFAYRHSVFKTPAFKNHIITSLTLQLSTQWQPKLEYGPLRAFSEQLSEAEREALLPMQVFEQVVATREQKLPDPEQLGNAGSFFKNPQLDSHFAEKLKQQYPDMPTYPAEQAGKTKLAAGWLIDQCQLKGHVIGGAQVHREQALVLVNTGKASSADVLALARFVQQQVFERFAIQLEPEVRIMASSSERTLN